MSRFSKTKFRKCSGTPKLNSIKRSGTDCLYTLLVADGSRGPFYYSTKNEDFTKPKFGIKKGIVEISTEGRGFGADSFLKYLDYVVKSKYLVKGDLLILDNETSFRSRKAARFLSKNGILCRHFPSGLGSILDPCDNSFNAQLKNTFYEFMSFSVTSDTQTKMSFAEKAYWRISNEAIHNKFKHCGLIGQHYRRQVRILVSEGMIPSKKFLTLHRGQIQDFLIWAHKHEYDLSMFETKSL